MEKFVFNGFLGHAIEEAYEKGVCLCSGFDISEAEGGNFACGYNKEDYTEIKSVLGSFHVVETHGFVARDASVCGIQADHFAVEIGYSEFKDGVPRCWEKIFRSGDFYDGPLQVIVWANHKGSRAVSIFTLPYSYNDLYVGSH